MRVFVYGTLTDPHRADGVLDTFEYCGPATLVGCHRVSGTYPTLAPGGSVAGRVLDTDAVDALDRYEGVAQGLYVRVTIPTDDGPVATYVGDPGRLGVSVDWPGDGPFERRVRAYVRDHVHLSPVAD